MKNFKEYITDWRQWSNTDEAARIREQIEEGWETTYPHWNDLFVSATRLMTKPPLSKEEESLMGWLWAISEETEDFAQFCSDHLDECWENLVTLSSSEFNKARWQVYSILWQYGQKAEDILRKGLEDKDKYCQRRALLSLAKLKPKDSKDIALRFSSDSDSYLRLSSCEMALASEDEAFIRDFQKRLINDGDQFVREKARLLI